MNEAYGNLTAGILELSGFLSIPSYYIRIFESSFSILLTKNIIIIVTE